MKEKSFIENLHSKTPYAVSFQELVIPAYNESPATIIYFILYIFAGVFFLTAILLAIIVENYWAYSYKHVKHERRSVDLMFVCIDVYCTVRHDVIPSCLFHLTNT